MTETPKENKSSRDQFESVLSSLDGYQFTKFMTGLKKDKKYFVAGRTLTSAEFDDSGVNKKLLDEIDESLKEGNVALLVAAKRMGTSTLGRVWVEKDEKNRDFLTTSLLDNDDYTDLIPDNPQKEIFLDEFTGHKPQMFDLVVGLNKQGRKLVLRPFPTTVDTCKEELTKRGINFKEVDIKPLDEGPMNEYLSKRLNLKEDDKFVKALSNLSGGSLLVANIICMNLASEAKYGKIEGFTTQKFRDILRESWRQVKDMAILDWNEERNVVPAYLRELYPDPVLQGIAY